MAQKKLAPNLCLLLAVWLAIAPVSTQPAAAQSPQSFSSGIAVCPAALQPVELINPLVITTCTRAGIQAALNQGGHIRFNCGPGPVTIPIDQTLVLSTTRDTVLDGGGLVTLDGQDSVRILSKDWHDPNTVGTITITLQNLRLVRGRAPSGGSTGDHSGGAIRAGHPGTRLHIIDSTFENNATRDTATPDNQGGAIFVHNAYELVISGSVFSGNSAGNGGAVGIIAAGLEITNSRFSSNRAVDASGGGIVRGYGGAIHLDGVSNSYNPNSSNQLRVCGATFADNSAYRGGGAIGAVVSDNLGTTAHYEKSTFFNNRVFGVDGQNGQGGAIYHVEDDHAGGTHETNLVVREVTFEQNQALRQGGGLWVYLLGRGVIINTTFADNRTTAGHNQVGQGGAMAVTLGAIDITNTVFAYNHADYQGGALHGGGTSQAITLTNTIFLHNTLNEQEEPSPTRWQGYHTNRPMLDGGQNIQHPRFKPTYDNDVNNWITANPIFLDPLLQPPADNGGPTRTLALSPASPAVNQGLPAACPPLDQRGYLRQAACDIGPFEYGGLPFIPSNAAYLPLIKR